MTDVLFLSASDIKKLVSMRDVIDAVEDSFRAYGKGTTHIAPVVLTMVGKYEGEHEIKSGYVEGYCIGTKIITYYGNNAERFSLPPLFGIIVLNDITNGTPLAIMDGDFVTASRTGAAGAVAAKYLARNESKAVAVIGAGIQGRFQIAALSEIFQLSGVRIYDRTPEKASSYVSEMSAKYNFKIQAAKNPKEALEGADIVITATASTSPLVLDEWIKPGMHINAIGADAPGKQELDPRIVSRAKVVVDNVAQCMERGEIQTAVKQGLLTKDGIFGELSDLILGRKPGRQSTDELTLFDATGLAIQDITVANTAYQLARRAGVGVRVQLN